MKEALLAHFSDIPMEERYVPSRVGPPTLCSSEARFRHNFRVLVPGAGLGRLAYEVAKLGESVFLSIRPPSRPRPGFSCQGNELSHYMLTSFLILNRCARSPPPIPTLLSTILKSLPGPKDAASKPAHDLPLRPHALQRARPCSSAYRYQS